MRKRGRPRKNGAQPGWTFFRAMFALYGYNEARAAGIKHSSAVTEAVSVVRSRCPGMPISETQVKRILAEYQPEGVPIAWKVTKTDTEMQMPPAVREALGIPESSKMRSGFTFGFGPRPEYPRSNAKLNKSKPVG